MELDGCAVMFWPGLKTTTQGLKFWWTAEDVTGMGMNKIVVGNKIHDVTYQHPDPADTSSKIIWPWRFGAAIACYSDSNALIANNLISKSTTSMNTTVVLDGDKLTVPYLVDNRYGIDVNQILLGAVIGKYTGHKCPPQPGTLTPSCLVFQTRPGHS